MPTILDFIQDHEEDLQIVAKKKARKDKIMTHLTEEEYQVIQARQQTFTTDNHEADPGPESGLAIKIRDWAEVRGYPCLIHPQTKKLSWFIPGGYPDVVLSLPFGHTLYLELKSSKGVWKKNQQLIAGQLNQLGHQYFIIRSFKRFCEITEGILTRE